MDHNVDVPHPIAPNAPGKDRPLNKEERLDAALMESLNEVITHRDLIDILWPAEGAQYIDDVKGNIKTQMYNARKRNPHLNIVTVFDQGYIPKLKRPVG